MGKRKFSLGDNATTCTGESSKRRAPDPAPRSRSRKLSSAPQTRLRLARRWCRLALLLLFLLLLLHRFVHRLLELTHRRHLRRLQSILPRIPPSHRAVQRRRIGSPLIYRKQILSRAHFSALPASGSIITNTVCASSTYAGNVLFFSLAAEKLLATVQTARARIAIIVKGRADFSMATSYSKDFEA